MEEIVRFSRLLRENNIPASLRSTQAAYETLKLFKDDEDVLNEALASVYVKNNHQRVKFDKIFKSMFGDGDKSDESKETLSSSGSNAPKNKNLLRGYNYSFKILDPSKIETNMSESDTIDYRPPLDNYTKP